METWETFYYIKVLQDARKQTSVAISIDSGTRIAYCVLGCTHCMHACKQTSERLRVGLEIASN